jgi:hypothetical protein
VSDVEKADRLYNFFTNGLAANSNLKSIPDAIDTKSNLNSEVLQQIVLLMGLDFKPFEPFKNFMDEVLLKNRNKIAHGQHNFVDFHTYNEIDKNTLILIRQYKNQIQNSVVSKSYFIS